MSLLPLILNEIMNEVYVPTALRAGYLRPWRQLGALVEPGHAVKSDDKEFSVKLDVNHFKPEELKVKLENGYAVVEGRHEERSDEHGFVSRQFVRRYKLPDDAVQETLASSLSSDGVLTVQAAKKPREASAGREINIVRTNQPALKEVAPAKEDAK